MKSTLVAFLIHIACCFLFVIGWLLLFFQTYKWDNMLFIFGLIFFVADTSGTIVSISNFWNFPWNKKSTLMMAATFTTIVRGFSLPMSIAYILCWAEWKTKPEELLFLLMGTTRIIVDGYVLYCDQNANHQRRLLIQFLRSYKRLMNTMRISPHSPLFIGHILAPKINGVTINANILIITKGDLQFWRNGDNGFMMVEQNNRFSSNQIREITTDADKFKLNLVTRENEVPAFTVCFLWRSEFEDAVEVLKGHTTFKKPVSMSRVSVNPAARCIRNITEFVARCIWNMTDLRFYAYLICSALFILYVGIILIGSKSKVLPTDSAISLSSSHSHVDPFGSASFLIYPAVSTSGAASRVRRDHHTLDGYFKTHLSWLTDAQTEELRVMETEGKSQAEVEEKIRQFYEVSPEDVKATARGLLQKGCETVMQRVFGEFNAEEIIQAKEEGASNAEIDEKIDEALAQIRNPQKRQEAARFAMACRRIFTMIERRRREVPMAMEKTP